MDMALKSRLLRIEEQRRTRTRRTRTFSRVCQSWFNTSKTIAQIRGQFTLLIIVINTLVLTSASASSYDPNASSAIPPLAQNRHSLAAENRSVTILKDTEFPESKSLKNDILEPIPRLVKLSRRQTSAPTESLPSWVDYETMKSQTLGLSNTISPIFLHHLFETKTPVPYDRVHLISAFLDPRPILVDSRYEIILHSILNGRKQVNSQRQREYPRKIVECNIVVRDEDSGKVQAFKTPVTSLIAHARAKNYMTLSQGQHICSLTSIPDDIYESIRWQNSEIYVTLTAIGSPPATNAFLRVRPIAPIDVDEHRSGRGAGAVCIAPMRGDVYAPMMKDHISYQRSLGFSRIYAYLHNPGPVTLSIVRELAITDPDFIPIRWGIPLEWSATARTQDTHMNHDYLVDPNDWNLKGIDVLDLEREKLLGVEDDGHHARIGVWYYGQAVAVQDCHMRAMSDNIRWVSVIDWDEFLVLQPSGQPTWTPPARNSNVIDAMKPFLEWVKNVPLTKSINDVRLTDRVVSLQTATRLDLDINAETEGLLPSGLLFSHSFGSALCSPRTPPTQTRVLKEIMDHYGRWDWMNPGITVPVAFSTPIGFDYLRPGQRSKKIIDPWAYFLDGTHDTVQSYLSYTLQHGACHHSLRSTPDRRICAQNLLRTLSSHLTPVPLPPSFSKGAKLLHSEGKTYSGGSLRHFRVINGQAKKIFALTKNLTELPQSLLNSKESTDLRSKDYGACKYSKTDWNLVEVMEQSLKWIFEDRVKMISFGPAPVVELAQVQQHDENEEILEGEEDGEEDGEEVQDPTVSSPSSHHIEENMNEGNTTTKAAQSKGVQIHDTPANSDQSLSSDLNSLDVPTDDLSSSSNSYEALQPPKRPIYHPRPSSSFFKLWGWMSDNSILLIVLLSIGAMLAICLVERTNNTAIIGEGHTGSREGYAMLRREPSTTRG